MNIIFKILFLCTFTYNLFSNDCYDSNRILFVPKNDSNPFECDIKHLWVGLPNLVLSHRSDIIELSANNSEFTKMNDYTGELSDAIIPLINDTIIVHAKVVNFKNDTLTTFTKFYAIYPPNIDIVLREEYLYLDSNKCIHTEVNINNYNKTDYERYFEGALPIGENIYKDGKLIEHIDPFDFEKDIDYDKLLVKGNTLYIPSYVYTDQLTGLNIFTKEIYYLIK